MSQLEEHCKEASMETRVESPSHFLLKVDSFSMVMKNGIHRFESKEFAAGDYKWRLIIYPNGIDHGSDYVSVFLALSDKDHMDEIWEINALFSIFLFNHFSCDYLYTQWRMRRFLPVKSEWGFPKFIPKKILTDPANGYLVNDVCVFGAEVFLPKGRGGVIQNLSMQKDASATIREWNITSYSKLEKVGNSGEFTVQGYKWDVKLHPKGSKKESKNVSVFLELIDSKSFAAHQKVKVDFSICIKNQLNSAHIKKTTSVWFSSSINDWGWNEFMPIADMEEPTKGFLVKDSCLVEAEIYVHVVADRLPEPHPS